MHRIARYHDDRNGFVTTVLGSFERLSPFGELVIQGRAYDEGARGEDSHYLFFASFGRPAERNDYECVGSYEGAFNASEVVGNNLGLIAEEIRNRGGIRGIEVMLGECRIDEKGIARGSITLTHGEISLFSNFGDKRVSLKRGEELFKKIRELVG
ncbi:MAG: hypothetical protein AABX66_00925 [Nanoarchaeota archaeon]